MDPQGGATHLIQADGSGQREASTAASAQEFSVDVDYQPIIETAIAGLTDNTPDARREIYALARGVVKCQLELMRLPEPVIGLEQLALDLTIGKIERRWQAREAESVDLLDPTIGPIVYPRLAEAGRLRRLARPIGFRVGLSVIAVAIFCGLYAERGIVGRSLVAGWSFVTGGEPGTTSDLGTDAAAADLTPAQIAAMMAAACGSDPSAFESSACTRDASASSTAGEAPTSGSEPPWLSRFAAFADMTSGRATSDGPSRLGAVPEDRPAGTANPEGALAWNASPKSASGAPNEAASQRSESSPARPVNAKVTALIESGKRATLKGDVDRAVRDFSDAIRIDPKYPDSYAERGQALFKLGEIERAVADYSEALARDPEHAGALRARGMAYLYRGTADLALADLSKVIELAERYPTRIAAIELFYARRSRSSIYGAKQQYDLEIADCTALIETYARDPALVDALTTSYSKAGAANLMAMVYRQRANAFLHGANFERAVADLTEAIPLSADHGYAALLDRSRLHEQLGQLDLAMADAQAALAIVPASEQAQLALGRLGTASRPNAAKPNPIKGL